MSAVLVYGVLTLLWVAVIVLASKWPDDDRPEPPRRIPLAQLAEHNPDLSTRELVFLQELELANAEADYAEGAGPESWPQIHGWHAGDLRRKGKPGYRPRHLSGRRHSSA